MRTQRLWVRLGIPILLLLLLVLPVQAVLPPGGGGGQQPPGGGGGGGQPPGGNVIPEIDPSAGVAGLLLMAGVFLILLDRRREQKAL